MSPLLLIFGATGATGGHLLRLALEAGLRVRVYVRSPHKLPEALRADPALEVVQGDFSNSEAIQAAVAGATWIACAAGDKAGSRDQKPMLALVQDIVAGMRAHGVRRFVYQAGAFSPAPGSPSPFFLRAVLRPTIGAAMGISGMLADNDAVIAWLHAECPDLDWTVTRPGFIKEAPSRGALRASDKPGGACHFVDLAAFTLALARSDEHLRAFPYVAY